MEGTIKPMEYNEAKEISKWTYKDPYSIYNMDEDDIKELMNGTYFSAVDKENNLIGYYCFGEAAQVPVGHEFGVYEGDNIIDIGLGIKPSLCGQGLGGDFLSNGLNFVKNKLLAKEVRLTVATFNQRAIKTYKRAGFKNVNSFERISDKGKIDFWVMIKAII